jgi:DNA repair exonuclease SbcCD ATPase subunit
MVISAQAEAEASQAKIRQQLAELAARQRAMETEYAEVMNKAREEAARITAQAVSESERMREVESMRRDQAESELQAELARLRRETETRVDEQIRTTNQECELRVLDAKQEAERRLRVANEQIDRRLQDARRALDESNRKRISVLEQLMQVHGTLESIPAILDNAYQEMNITPESGLALSSAQTYEVAVSYESGGYEDTTAMVVETVDGVQYDDDAADEEVYVYEEDNAR